MAPIQGTITHFFKAAQPASSRKPDELTGGANPNPNPAVRSPSVISQNTSVVSDAWPKLPVGKFVVKSSDDEDSGSDSSLEDLAQLLQSQSSKNLPKQSSKSNGPATPPRARFPRNQRMQHRSPLTIMPKYSLDLRNLVKQAEKHDASEAKVQKIQSMYAEENKQTTEPQDSTSADHSRLLQSVVTETEGSDADKVLQAVKRTEATRVEQRWCFFNSRQNGTEKNISQGVSRRFPKEILKDGWQRQLMDPAQRDSLILSGLARDMIMMDDDLPEELFRWFSDKICLESRDNMRQSCCELLKAAPSLIHRYLQPENISRMFLLLGAQESAVDLNGAIDLLDVNLNDVNAYEAKDWTPLRAVIGFLGDISQHLLPRTCTFAMSILARLCADSIVWDNVSLLNDVQITMRSLCNTIGDDTWEDLSQSIYMSIYKTVKQPSLRLQILHGIPCTTPKLHELRRRLAFAFFNEDLDLTNLPTHESFDLWRITTRLDSPNFKIRSDTNYVELAATMATLDIAIDNGRADDLDLHDKATENEFNTDIDALERRIRVIWSGINDAGPSLISRIDAKEAMEGIRYRLAHTVRTRVKPKMRIFDTEEPAEIKSIQKQARFMEARFKKAKTNASISGPLKTSNT